MSQKFYSSVIRHKGQIFANWFDENGERHITKEKYAPYLFLDNPRGDYRTVYGKSVSRVDYDNVWDAQEVIKKRKVHGITNWEYQYIYENFQAGVYNRDLLNIAYLDIETDVEGGYPNIEIADKEITLIQLLVNGEMWVFGRKDFDTRHLWKDGIVSKTKQVRYFQFESEALMLRKFIRIWEMLYIDAVTGWNTRMFDIPYIIRRLLRVLGQEFVDRLSPYGLAPNERNAVLYGRDVTIYSIPGVADIDYMELYRKFLVPLRGQPESFALDFIAEQELGVKKIDYKQYGNLGELYKKNPQKYAEYGVRDADLIAQLDDKLNLIEIALVLAFDAGVNLTDVFGTVRPWDAIIHRYLMEKKIVVPNTGTAEDTGLKIEGGHVKVPQNGMHRWVVSFDLTSLYPHVIIQNNMGAESKIQTPNAPVRSDDFLKPDFDKRSFCDEHTVLAGNGAMFSNKTQSFLSALMEETFNKRKVYKKKMLEAAKQAEAATSKAEKKEWEDRRIRFDNLQHATKIKLNSAYGALANRYNRWYDTDIAEGITQSGQVAIKWAERAVNQKINQMAGTEGVDYVVAIDTDSLYITLEAFMDRVFEDQSDTKKMIRFLDEVCNREIAPVIDEAYEELARMTDAFSQKMEMKREALANKGIWTGKKHYVLNVHNNEGVEYDPPKRKMVGIEAVKSSTPGAARKFIEEALGIILDKDEEDLHDFIQAKREEYATLPLDEIAFPRGCNGIEKWSDKDTLYRKGCPIHVSSAINFNSAIKQLGLTEYPEIKSGDKIKFVYLVKKNPYRFNTIAFMTHLPEELNLDSLVDRKKQFDKGFLNAVKSFTDVIGWTVERKANIEQFFS